MLRTIIITIALVLISNLSAAQADSLIGEEIKIYLKQNNKSVNGEFKGCKNNRVMVLFDNSLHDYFFSEIKTLEIRGLNFKIDDSGKFIEIPTLYKVITEHGNYKGYIISQTKIEIFLSTTDVGKLYIQKANIIQMKKIKVKK